MNKDSAPKKHFSRFFVVFLFSLFIEELLREPKSQQGMTTFAVTGQKLLLKQRHYKYYKIIYPYEAANGPQPFAIVRRNKYLAEKADVSVCYVSHSSATA